MNNNNGILIYMMRYLCIITLIFVHNFNFFAFLILFFIWSPLPSFSVTFIDPVSYIKNFLP